MPPARSNLASVVLEDPSFGHVVVMAHNRQPLGDAEWEDRYLAHIRRVKELGGAEKAANVVFAEGKGPNSVQRARGNAIFGASGTYRFKVAVVTDSILVRGAVTAIGWFNPFIRAFDPDAWQRAFAHARVGEAHLGTIRAALLELRAKIADVEILNRIVDRFDQALERSGPE